MPLPTKEDITKLAYETLVGRKNTDDIASHFQAVFNNEFKGSRIRLAQASLLLMQVAPIVIQKYLETHGNSEKLKPDVALAHMVVTLQSHGYIVCKDSDTVAMRVKLAEKGYIVMTDGDYMNALSHARDSAKDEANLEDCMTFLIRNGYNIMSGPDLQATLQKQFDKGVKHEKDRVRRERESRGDADVVYTEKPEHIVADEHRRFWESFSLSNFGGPSAPGFHRPGDCHSDGSSADVSAEADDSQDERKWVEPASAKPFSITRINESYSNIYDADRALRKDFQPDEESYSRLVHEKTDAGQADSPREATMQSVWRQVARAFGWR